MTTPDEYRAYAAECLKAMELATVEEIKAELLQIARLWSELAELAERYVGSLD
jgi:hypothetical protein